MTTHIRHLAIDCADPSSLAQFWSAVLERPVGDDDHLADDVCAIKLPDGNQPELILFIRVPEGKVVKNRLHLDISPADRTLLEEVERIKALGATVEADRRGPRGLGWFVMLDPAGNEFCVESSTAEIAAVHAAIAAETPAPQ